MGEKTNKEAENNNIPAKESKTAREWWSKTKHRNTRRQKYAGVRRLREEVADFRASPFLLCIFKNEDHSTRGFSKCGFLKICKISIPSYRLEGKSRIGPIFLFSNGEIGNRGDFIFFDPSFQQERNVHFTLLAKSLVTVGASDCLSFLDVVRFTELVPWNP